jgi:peptidoglycan/xylan/chitin deacetylase (PgdA/CDA1 family)
MISPMRVLPRQSYITFHGIGVPDAATPDDERPYWVSVAVLERIVARLGALEAANDVAITITCDDGFVSDHDHVLRTLLAVGRTGAFFPIGRRIGKPGSVSSRQLRDMFAAGMEIGSHGDAHVSWLQLDDTAMMADMMAGRRRLEDILGAPVTSASVPFGAYDARVVEVARRAGFTRILTSAGGFATATTGLIPRTSIKACFDPEVDLDRLVGVAARVRSSVMDRVKRWRHRG